MSRRWWSALAILCALALSGCLRLDASLVIGDEDTVSGTIDFAVLNEWAISQGSDPASLVLALEEELAANPGSEVAAEIYNDGSYTGLVWTLTEVPWQQLSQVSNQALTLRRDGEQIYLEGNLADLTGTGSSDEIPWDMRLSVTFPHPIQEHNGQLEGQTVTWTLNQDSTDLTFFATTEGTPQAWWRAIPPAVPVLAAIVAIGCALTWWLARRRRRGDARDVNSSATTELAQLFADRKAGKTTSTKQRSPGTSKPRPGNR